MLVPDSPTNAESVQHPGIAPAEGHGVAAGQRGMGTDRARPGDGVPRRGASELDRRTNEVRTVTHGQFGDQHDQTLRGEASAGDMRSVGTPDSNT